MKVKIGLFLSCIAVGGMCSAAQDGGTDVSYEVSQRLSAIAHHPWATLEEVKVTRIAGVSTDVIAKINKHLDYYAKVSEDNVHRCIEQGMGEFAWEFRHKFYRIHRAGNYLGVVFDEVDKCWLKPTKDKNVYLFSLSNGERVHTPALLRAFVPSLKKGHYDDIAMRTMMYDEAAQRLIADSKAEMGSRFDPRCLSYLKVHAYRVWIKDQFLVFFPANDEENALCEREYFVKWDN